MDLKPQDLLVLYKAAAHRDAYFSYASLGEQLLMSASEVHASVKRSMTAGLAVMGAERQWRPARPALFEFAVHGVRYVWPAALGPVKRGVPTSFGVEPLAGLITAAPGESPVWQHPAGQARGPAIKPIYRTAPDAALNDSALHTLLALQDALRVGRARERALAEQILRERLGVADL